MTGGTLNLSLLSRGVGEVHSNGHERVDVFLEPEDYYNFTRHPDRLYLPPLQASFDHDQEGSQYTSRSQKDSYRVPKTFTTRKGALLLFSEDLAQRNTESTGKGKGHLNTLYDNSSNCDSQQPLRTVEDLTKSILKYGGQDAINNKVYLKFVRTHRDNLERQIRPGFSAKRYLATWTRNWDDSVFENVLKHGYITERSLYKANKAAPNLKRRLLYEDLSLMPKPYKLMRNMLLTPSSLSGYTFYRVPTDLISLDEQAEEETEVLNSNKRPGSVSNIRVIRTVDTSQEVVDYNDLDRESQTNVITDLLVKSAVHYALIKQEELYEKSIMRAMNGDGLQGEDHVETFEFNMKEAVESLLDSHNGKYSLRSSIPDIDDRNNNFDMAAFRKAESSHVRTFKLQGFTPGRMSESDGTDTDIPSVSSRSGSTSSEFSGIPVLPPIRHTLSPIKDVSRETSQMVVLPSITRGSASLDLPTVNIQPATPQHSTLTALSSTSVDATQEKSAENIDPSSTKVDAVKSKKKAHKKDAVLDALSSGVMFQPPPLSKPTHYHQEAVHLENFHFGHHPGHSSITSLVDSLDVINRRHWLLMGRKAESLKGSVIMAPDGEIVSVGGSVAREGVHRSDVGNMSDVLPSYRNEGTDESGLSEDELVPWNMEKKLSLSLSIQSKSSYQRGSLASSSVSREDFRRLSSTGKSLLWNQTSRTSADSSSQVSGVSEKDIMDTLADHAHRIAENVLSQSGTGSDLEMDVKQAADLWTQTHPKRTILRALSGSSEAIDEIMKSSSPSSIASSAAEYRRSLVSKSSTSADPALLTSNHEISPEVIKAMSSHSLTPEKIEVVSDGEDKMKLKVKVDLDQVMGGVQHGHLHIAHGSDTEDGLGKRHVSIKADAATHLDDSNSNLDVISYQVPDAEVESRSGTSKSTSQPKEIPQEVIAGESKSDREIDIAADKEVVPLEEESSPGEKLDVLAKSGHTLTPILKIPERKDLDTVKEVKEVRLITPQKSDATTESKVKKDKKSPDQKEEPFVVGGVDHKNELTMLYGGEMPTAGGPPLRAVPPKKSKGKPREKKQKKEPGLKKETAGKKEEKKTKKGKKGKKAKKKEEESSPPEQPLPAEVAPAVVEEKQPTPPPPPVPDEREETPMPSSPEAVSEEEDFEFNFIREATSPPPAEASKLDGKEVVSDQEEVGESDEEDITAASYLKSISNKEARAAKRAAAAAKRREEVERRRREKDEQSRRQKEEVERQIALQKEMEEQNRRREEERRLRKLQELEAEEREKREQEELERRKKLEAEREKRAKEEHQRKMDEFRRKTLEEEMRRHELLLEQQKEEERLRLEEELMMSKMAEEERLEYERRKKMIEEERKRREEEERLQREEENRKAIVELQLREAEKARELAKIEARLRFDRSLWEESGNLTQAHQVNRAFVFSYFELLQWLGLDVPDFELAKMANF